ncbi:hypothetical protein [Nitrosomonas sp. sh817]|uniref:hypothetical protein n=1 Tax=Nitrosomonas sp. sh817 TaxID=3070658 RepID=UPI0027DD680C|nr:hypothetical protein [Nitrosomonas sp. sh817]WMJ08133.1 hypothetical protein RBH92_11965 [Nitrosomonas sp. sh817]
MIDTIGYCDYSSLGGKRSLSFFANQPIIRPNNTPQAYPELTLSDAQTEGLLISGAGNAI